MKRILFVLPSLSAANGVASFLLNYLEEMKEPRLSFSVLAGDDNPSRFREEVLERLSVPYHYVPTVEHVGIRGFYRALSRFFDTHEGFSAIYNNAENWSPFLLSLARRHGVRSFLLHAHATKPSGKPLRSIRNRLLTFVSLPFVSERAACSYAAGRAFYGRADFKVIPNAVDPSRFAFDEALRKKKREELGISEETALYGFVGRISRQKNPFFFLSLAEILSDTDAKIIMVGDGEDKAALLRETRIRGLTEKILFLPPTREVAPLYFAMDAFLLPSHFEGLPVVAVEAQMAGLPCLISDTVSRECAFSEGTHFLPRGDVALWKRMLPKEKKRFSAYDSRFDMKETAKEMEKLLLSL